MPPQNATILTLNVPPKTLLGIDLLSFDSSPSFQGIAKIPPGIHFLYSGTDASLAIRHGCWLNIRNSDSRIFKWNSGTELLESAELENTENVISQTSTRGTVNYAALLDATSDLQSQQRTSHSSQPATNEAGEWPKLVSHISTPLLNRTLPEQWVASSVSSAPSDTESIPGLSHLEASEGLNQLPLNFLSINLKQTWDPADIGPTRTEHARDRSWYLSQLITSVTPVNGTKADGAKEILGELQLCFLMVLTLANYSCMEQWKRLLSVLFTCKKALRDVTGFFVEAVKVLESQILHVEDVEGGLFDLRDESASSWLRHLWERFRGNIEEVFEDSDDQTLREAVASLQEIFEERYGWQNEKDVLRRGMVELEDGERVELDVEGVDEDEEKGEYAPVVVEL